MSPWFIGFLAFMLVPMAMSLYYSFTDYPLLEPPLWAGLENYARLLSDPVFGLAVRNTLVYTAVAVPACTVLALVLAAMLNGRARSGGLLQSAIFLPTLVPLAASAMIWMWLFNGEFGLINRALGAVGIRGPNWLADERWVMPALIIVALWGVGQAVVVYIAALQDVPAPLYEAAGIDGMGPVRRFWHITLPMLSPVILFNVITLTIGSMQVFAVPYILTKAAPGGPVRAMYFYTMDMYDHGFVYGQMGYASAMAWVQLLIVLALTGFTFLVSRRLVHYRGL